MIWLLIITINTLVHPILNPEISIWIRPFITVMAIIKIKIGSILPLIAADELNNSTQQKNKIIVYLLIITSLAVLVIFFLIMMFKQLNRAKAKEKIIEVKNAQLEQINNKLLEDAKIK